MKKILLVVEREFLTRVRKKSFIILSILGPLFFASLMVVPTLLAQIKDTTDKTILIADQTGYFSDKLNNENHLTFTSIPYNTPDSLRGQLVNEKAYALLYIEGSVNTKPAKVVLYSNEQINIDVEKTVKRQIEKIIENEKLKGYNIENLSEILKEIKTTVPLSTIRWDESGKEKESYTGVLMGAAMAVGMAIYFFIFMFGSMVMRGVIEEKSSRIIEVVVSSIKPFQLMLGKIIGIAAVGLLQFIILIVFTFGIVLVVQGVMGGDVQQTLTDQVGAAGISTQEMASSLNGGASISAMLASIPLASIITYFFFFFIGGYLLYASMFAAIGSAVENEADTQQLILPITIPLIIAIFIMMNTFQYPNSALSFWASIIPFTSPIVMMARIPFGVPFWEIALSLVVLYASFILFTWATAKIYRVGILMYGKKPSFKEMLKWMTYKS